MLNPRWQKIWSDLWDNKARTLLVMLSIVAGVVGVGIIINTRAILDNNFAGSFAAVNPASATLQVNPFDDEMVEAIRRIPEVQTAEGRRKLTVRLQVGANEWLDLELYALPDFEHIRINKIRPEVGAWPPPKHQLLLERSVQQISSLGGMQLGDELVIETPDQRLRSLGLAGFAFDFNQTPTPGSNKVYGYITLDTLKWLGQPRTYNELSFVVAENPLDEAHIRQVAAKVSDKLEKNGQTVYVTLVPPPGEHPLNDPLSALLWIMGALGAISLLGSAFLTVNLISAMLAQQMRQVGIMKAIGAQTYQLMSLYFAIIVILSLLALVMAIPLGVGGAYLFANFIAATLNLDLQNWQIPPLAVAVQITIGLLVPFAATFYAIRRGVNLSVREALSDYGISQQSANTGRVSQFLEGLNRLPRPMLLSWRNTFRRKERLVLTLAALSLSGALFIATASIRTSVLGTLDDSFAYRHYDIQVNFSRPYRLDKIERPALQVAGLVEAESFSLIAPVNRLRADGSESDNLLLFALPGQSRMLQPPVQQGRWLRSEDRNAAVINTALWRDEPDIALGDEIILKIDERETGPGLKTLREKEIRGQVVGIFEEGMAQPSIYLNYPYLANLTGSTGRVTNVWLKAQQQDTAFVSEAAKKLERQLELAGLRVNSTQTISAKYEGMAFHFNILSLTLLMMAVLLAVVGGFGLMGTMSVNVIERTREIGIMRAIGASNWAVGQVFMVEGLLIGLISWPIGVVLALPPSKHLSDLVGLILMETPLNFTFSIGSVFLWLIIVMVIAMLSSLLPAWQAVRLKVREVLAYG